MSRNLNSLADRLLRVIGAKKKVVRTDPLTFNIGLDFGTAFTKCLIRNVANNIAYPLFLSCNGESTFLIPSEVRVKQKRLNVPFDINYEGEPINYLKMALTAVVEPRERLAWLENVEDRIPVEWRNAVPQHVEALTIYFLARILAEALRFIETQTPDFGQLEEDRCFVNMAVPVGHAQLRHVERKFLLVLRHAYALMRLPDFRTILVEDIVRLVAEEKFSENYERYCYLYPEVSANVQSYIKSPAARRDLHLFVDVGAGTVDLSAFIYYPRSKDGRTLNYMAADVLTLGSSQIELRAAARCGGTIETIRQFKETGRADAKLLPQIRAAVQEAKNDIEGELYPRVINLLKKVRDLIPTAHDRTRRDTQFYRAQLLLGGGGLCDVPYKSAIKRAMLNVKITDPPIVPLPVPEDLIWPERTNVQKERAFSRLSVAYGLSFLKATLDEHRYPYEIRPYLQSQNLPKERLKYAPTKDDV
jgi:hypothetical protein